ncbi:hypothetical protein D3C72_2257490 [compost metagenome]
MMCFQHGALHPVKQALPVGLAYTDQGQVDRLLCLYQGSNFEKFIHGTPTTRHHDKALGVFGKHQLTDKEIVETKVLINV